MVENKLNFDDETKQRVFQQVMDIFVNPEIERRIKRRAIKEGTPITRIQIVFNLDKGKNEIRLNEEVKAIINGKATRDIQKGEVIYESDIDDIGEIELTDEDINCGHITLLFFRNNWIISFDFRYNQERVKEHIEASKEFYETAINSLENNRLRAFYENAFATAELSAKSILLLLPDKDILNDKSFRSHGKIEKKLTSWANLGNVKPEFSTILSKLKSLRDSARYVHSEDYKSEDSNKIKEIIKEMVKSAEDSIK
ncbi:MAG: HEPN domain-containing protein [Nanoarchaeota archaeon]|nr:HEPN domain-containing protein [Nanoarchaeota archaeon]